jgi:diacylglycerol kinase family enzyme
MIPTFVNPEAGSAQAILNALERHAGFDVRLTPATGFTVALRSAVQAGEPRVAVAGGDGTLASAAAVLAGTPTALAVIPGGTLNHFARDLGIPTDLEQAVRLIPRGEVRALDLGEVNGEVFINNSLLGFYPPVVKVRDRERRELGRGKWLATISALFKVLPRMPSLHVRIKADGLEIHRKTRFLFVGNNEYVMRAFNFGARERFDRGDLYLYIANTPSRLGLAGLALLSLVRDLKLSRRFDRWCLPELTVETRLKALPVYLDGEVTLMAPPLRYRTHPHGLKVILPPRETSGT